MTNFRARFFANQGLVTFTNQGPGFELDPSVGATNGGFIVPCYASGPSQLIVAAADTEFDVDVSATSPTTSVLISTSFKVTGTMPAGSAKGQIKTIRLLGASGANSEEFVLTGSNFLSPAPGVLPTITKYNFTFEDYLTLMWNGTQWVNIEQGSLEDADVPTPAP